MTQKDKDRRLLIIIMCICAVILTVGIYLSITVDVSENLWIGGFMAALLSGTFVILLFILGCKGNIWKFRLFPVKREKRNIKGDPKKKVWIISMLVIVLSLVLLICWFNSLSLFLCLGIILGAVGALIQAYKNQTSLKPMAFTGGAVMGALLLLFSESEEPKQYDYFVNGVKVGSGTGKGGDQLWTFLGTTILVGLLILGVAYGIRKMCGIAAKQNGDKDE